MSFELMFLYDNEEPVLVSSGVVSEWAVFE